MLRVDIYSSAVNVGKLKARLWIVEPRLRVKLGQRLQTTSTVC